jgi:hypothetical protein
MKRWQKRRNCALSARQLFQFYVLLICLSLIVGMGFLIAGMNTSIVALKKTA